MAAVQARKGNRFWFVLHSWLGLKLSLFMSFVLVTGTLAVFSSEMDWVTHASMRVEPRDASERASWGEMYAAARTTYPDWGIYNLTEPIDPWFAAQVYGRTPERHTRLIDIDPYTAEARGDRHWLSFHRFFRNTHRHLMLPTKYGVPIVSALSFVSLGSMITGILVYKKFWRGFFQAPRRGNARRLNGDLHRLCGAWTFDPVSGEPIASHRSGNAGLHQRISEMADPLHFGYFGGLPTKIVWFIFGAAMAALSITGMVIYGKRTVRSLQRRDAGARSSGRGAGSGKGWASHALDGMGRWKWTGVAAVIIVLILVPVTATQ